MKLLLLLLLLLLINLFIIIKIDCVDHKKFRTCEQTGFCNHYRNKNFNDNEKFYLINDDIKITDDKTQIHGLLTIGKNSNDHLKFLIDCTDNDLLHLKIEELHNKRFESNNVILNDNINLKKFDIIDKNNFKCGENLISITYNPFKIKIDDLFIFNDRLKSYFEHKIDNTIINDNDETIERSLKDDDKEEEEDTREIIDWGEDGKPIYKDEDNNDKDENNDNNNDENNDNNNNNDDENNNNDGRNSPESFNGHTDKKESGPQSVGFDLTFPFATHVYGIPEHATDLSLKSTINSDGGMFTGGSDYKEPYRLYNLDVFEYEMDQPMALYGAIPMMMALSKDKACGIYFNNPSEMFVDIEKNKKQTHWIAESGTLDLYFFLGNTPSKVVKQFTLITGRTELPPIFALGYHQCRWNYRDEADVYEVEENFEKYDIPVDVIWLDIEHTDGKRYFTWDKKKFPTPDKMLNKLSSHSRKMVTIIDPHIKRDNNYYVHKEATDNGYYIKKSDGKTDLDGWCWPGSSSYLDFTSEKVTEWWGSLFHYSKYQYSTKDLYTWNDMNEPSVFNGPEVSMDKNALSLSGHEHREWHNLYGIYFHRATSIGLIKRNLKSNGGDIELEKDLLRPFVLSRAFFAGTQRYGAIWTGDNAAEWSHLKASLPMLLSINLAGLSFSGADVGGFFGDPSTELLIRWYQVGAYQPFFRAHAHIETKRREPWVFDKDTLHLIKNAILSRYKILPYIYTLFEESYRLGDAVMRPMFYHYFNDEKTLNIENQYLLGKDLLIHPITSEKTFTASIYLPKSNDNNDLWYDFNTYEELSSNGYYIGSSINYNAPLDTIPVLQRGGSIVPLKLRLRRSSKTMQYDPYTLLIALNKINYAYGELYIDDEETFNYKNNNKIRKIFEFNNNNQLISKNLFGNENNNNLSNDINNIEIEKIIIIGYKNENINSITLNNDINLDFYHNNDENILIIRKPNIKVIKNFEININ